MHILSGLVDPLVEFLLVGDYLLVFFMAYRYNEEKWANNLAVLVLA